VLLVDGDQHALAVIPKTCGVDVAALNREFHRRFSVGRPDDLLRLYPGLPASALLPAGLDAGIEIYVDRSLVDLRHVAFETSSRGRLVRIEGEALPELLNGAWCGSISYRW
jgi:prolyl-tRNA editing enzyme YbaK/EbsC (Cys-tRNA(Pro) deacylase)